MFVEMLVRARNIRFSKSVATERTGAHAWSLGTIGGLSCVVFLWFGLGSSSEDASLDLSFGNSGLLSDCGIEIAFSLGRRVLDGRLNKSSSQEKNFVDTFSCLIREDSQVQ